MRRKLLAFIVLTLFVSAILVGAAAAQTGNGFDLSWNVIGGGGGKMTGSGFELSGTAGQSIVGSSSGSNFSIGHGFWVALLNTLIFLPTILKQSP